jgi:hypothetical protein
MPFIFFRVHFSPLVKLVKSTFVKKIKVKTFFIKKKNVFNCGVINIFFSKVIYIYIRRDGNRKMARGEQSVFKIYI